MTGTKLNPLVSWTVLTGLVLPPLLSWMVVRGVPSIDPREAERRMAQGDPSRILVDVRSSEEFDAVHIPGAVNIPYQTMSAHQTGAWRRQLEGKTSVMVVCDTGVISTRAARQLRQSGFSEVVSVAGGMDRWLQVAKGGVCFANPGHDGPIGPVQLVPRQAVSLFEQVLICVVAFGLKPLYELLALILAILLWRFRDADLTALRRSMIAFFLGENACTVNFLFFNDQSRLWEFFHSFGMLVAFGLFFYACMEALDHRVIRFSSPKERCALLATCGECYKHQDIHCRLHRIFLFVPLAAFALAFMLLTARPGFRFIHSEVLGDDVLFGHPLVPQLFEVRLGPLLAMPLFLAAWGALWALRERGFGRSKVLLAMGLGPLSFGFMRFLIYWGYSANPLWADAWEEMTEFLFVALLFWLILGMEQVRTSWPLRLLRAKSRSGQA